MDFICYGVVIYGALKQRDQANLSHLLSEMYKRGLKPDKVIYTSMIDADCKLGNIMNAFTFLDKMVEEGCVPNVVTYTVLIHGLCLAGFFDKAVLLCKDMLEKVTLPPMCLGAKVPQPGVEELSDDDEVFEEEEMKVESKDESDDLIESDLEVLGEDIVEPDNDPLQKMGDPSVEVTDESRVESQMAKSLAMEALVEGEFEKAIEHLTEAILLNPTSSIMYGTRASVYIKMKKPNVAIRDANAALESQFSGKFDVYNSDIVWSGDAWKCGKQLNHYPTFCRIATTITIHSFVFVMAQEENHYVAYLEDVHEDCNGQKKVRARWFHNNREVECVIPLLNQYPREVFIKPYAQVISAECVDGPTTILTPEHYGKCLAILSDLSSARVHLCCKEFRSNKVKPFDVSKLRGYFEQTILSCLEVEFKFNVEGTMQGANTSRNCNSYFKANENVEILCQDSGIWGCWFRCTVLVVSRKQLKVQYDDLMDEDGCGNLEEWVPAFRPAALDKLGMRPPRRLTIRPCPPSEDSTNLSIDIGAAVDVWWNDGWWEGVVTEIDIVGMTVCIFTSLVWSYFPNIYLLA
ncbi:hypothetical protein GIB67_024993 [Kingdonia uniflora]|uniref:BAH domain-containing protein n=1 Tax=Kingdonia uniflora TaxID=39325 RepID=A0A7J7N7C4_9MAGN|nr:hypothetical protein GIB67_024993 [Kingdonia uniflora]